MEEAGWPWRPKCSGLPSIPAVGLSMLTAVGLDPGVL